MKKKLVTLLDLCVSSLRRGHANLLCIVPILTDDPRRESERSLPPGALQGGARLQSVASESARMPLRRRVFGWRLWAWATPSELTFESFCLRAWPQGLGLQVELTRPPRNPPLRGPSIFGDTVSERAFSERSFPVWSRSVSGETESI